MSSENLSFETPIKRGSFRKMSVRTPTFTWLASFNASATEDSVPVAVVLQKRVAALDPGLGLPSLPGRTVWPNSALVTLPAGRDCAGLPNPTLKGH